MANVNTIVDAFKQFGTPFEFWMTYELTFKDSEIERESAWSTTLSNRWAILTGPAHVGLPALGERALARLVLDADTLPSMKDG